MVQVFIGLGSNLGRREEFLERAIAALAQTPGVALRRQAQVYETEPVEISEQPWFLNTVVEIETDLSPHELLTVCKRIERALGRHERGRYGPREIDLDILFYDDLIVHEDDLQIPHAQLHRRRFVLVPLSELAPHYVHPILHQTVAQLLAHVTDSTEVRPLRSRKSSLRP
ncbi:Bifunctional folate synthesis protein [bacterium HR07]|uniref:2-amino-4-hydroxy-6-hydroxymethyldihydropteridine diphosphokinase n=1 Tax=Acetithermum autotrophicum TaxID=1446466 RepID=H5SU82_ACEAU|nr:7,8-dihydro-6-hydroxymethylpterin-pyrophosphokinase [Candidatus Acetothermum autotrophicum]GBC76355.1 Bifunctional folate synthesis protein [bacterium HR07]